MHSNVPALPRSEASTLPPKQSAEAQVEMEQTQPPPPAVNLLSLRSPMFTSFMPIQFTDLSRTQLYSSGRMEFSPCPSDCI